MVRHDLHPTASLSPLSLEEFQRLRNETWDSLDRVRAELLRLEVEIMAARLSTRGTFTPESGSFDRADEN